MLQCSLNRLCSLQPHTYTYLLNGAESLLKSWLVSAASQEIHRIFGTRRFLTVPTSARHLSLSWANSIQSPQLPPTSWRAILILSSHLRLGLPNGLFLTGFPIRTLCTPLHIPTLREGKVVSACLWNSLHGLTHDMPWRVCLDTPHSYVPVTYFCWNGRIKINLGVYI